MKTSLPGKVDIEKECFAGWYFLSEGGTMPVKAFALGTVTTKVQTTVFFCN